MNNFTKTILISFLMVTLFPCFALAGGILDISFEQTPLFQESNFLPGNSIEHWVNVTNKSTESQPIGIEVVNYSSCTEHCFSDQLNLVISDGTIDLYSASLTSFFNAGEIKLSDLGAGNTQKYYLEVTFIPESGNEYKTKETSFDFKIGSFGKESIGGEIPGGGGGGGGGYSATGLIITNEIASPQESNANITWLTNKVATSRVVYSSEFEPHVLQLDNLPNYGYAHSTIEDSTPVMSHAMLIEGLSSGTTYYFRCISRGSFAVSQELSFTTPGEKKQETEEQDTQEETVPQEKQGPVEELIVAAENFINSGEENINNGAKTLFGEEPQESIGNIYNTSLAALTDFLKNINWCWVFFLIILVLIILFLLSKKEEEKKRKTLFWLIIILIILFCIYCRPLCLVLLITAIILFIISLIIDYFKKENKPQ
ncbi:MAG: hypothetical protein MCSN_0050 [Candidatus Microsyncoccus archaeolyticus]|nr:MAG: hypothetical protein MCSN_0050 [Candidatus Parcubacteria bacterium]